MMRGLPASGKSTKAKEIVKAGGNHVRVNRDLIREMLHFNKYTGKNERVTMKAQAMLVRHLLGSGKNVVVDDCNMGDYHRERWATIAEESDAKFEIVEMNTTIQTCLDRELDRDKVGVSAITQMALQNSVYPAGEKFILCDIDGTIADIKHRLHFVNNEDGTPKKKKDWKGFFGTMDRDEIRQEVVDYLNERSDPDINLVFVTARPDDYRDVTEEWMEEQGLGGYPVIMRRSGDKRPDTEVKQEMYDKYFKHYDVVEVIDDRPSVIRMWRSNGLNVKDVGGGVEF